MLNRKEFTHGHFTTTIEVLFGLIRKENIPKVIIPVFAISMFCETIVYPKGGVKLIVMTEE
jgi:hypothetical protein